MNWLRFHYNGRQFDGYLEGERVKAVSGDVFSGQCRETGLVAPLAEVTLDTPCRPTKVIGIGLNYRDHAAEMNLALPKEPVMFLKPPSSLLAPGAPIIRPAMTRRVDYEAELAVVIGRIASNVSVSDAPDFVFGLTCGNDVTARDLQQADQQWTRAKSFDTFCPLGPWIVTDLNPSDLEIILTVNGKVRQHSRTSRMLFGVAELVAFTSRVMTLLPGDVILTGTPAGIGPLQSGDTVTVRIEGLGELTNPVS
jgi:2-keto-4-pentenoate hydratase/2-oxohepta-3-ene-1,7-dioic acid hydratase in catechol pathway